MADTDKGKGRFEDDDVWGDAADDPMDALANMSDNDILNATRQFESEQRSINN
jgi:26S proteasome regulatory subunit T5